MHGVVLVFTDAPTKNLDLETELTNLRDTKSIKIIVVLAPQYGQGGTVGDPSYQLYERLSENRVYNMNEFNKTQFLAEVVQIIGEDCGGTTLSAPLFAKPTRPTKPIAIGTAAPMTNPPTAKPAKTNPPEV